MKSLMKKVGQTGVSIVESLIGIGLLGGIALVITQQAQNASKVETGISSSQEVNSFATHIRTTIAKKNNCSATFANKRVGDLITAIYQGDDPETMLNYRDEVTPQPQGKELYEVNKEIGKSRIVIKEMSIIQKPSLNSGQPADYLRVRFQPLNQHEIVRDFIFLGEKNVNGSYKTCDSAMGNEIDEGISQICKSIEGEWDEDRKVCVPMNLPGCFLTDETSCGTTAFKKDDRLYVEAGQMDFSEYDYTVCNTQYKAQMYRWQCRFNTAAIPNAKCKCQPYGCTCLADPIDCKSRWNTGCTLEFKVKQLTRCCRVGITPPP